MAHYEGAAPSRVFYGWWVAAAFSLIIFLSLFLHGAFMPPVGPPMRGEREPVAGGR